MKSWLVFRLEKHINKHDTEPTFELLGSFPTEAAANYYARKYSQEFDTKTLVLNGTIYDRN